MGQRNGHRAIARPTTLFTPRRKLSWVLIAWNTAFVVLLLRLSGHVTHIGKFVVVSDVSGDFETRLRNRAPH